LDDLRFTPSCSTSTGVSQDTSPNEKSSTKVSTANEAEIEDTISELDGDPEIRSMIQFSVTELQHREKVFELIHPN